MTLSRFIRAFSWLCGFSFAALHAGADAPSGIAIMPESLHRVSLNGSERISRGGALAEQVRLLLASDSRWVFVERAELSLLEREQALSATNRSSLAAEIRTGRLRRAEWVVSLRLLAVKLDQPAVLVEVFDTLRAERLAAVEARLGTIPDESWLISPNLETATAVSEVVLRALTEARTRNESQKNRLVFAPIGFVNLTRSEQIEPLDAALRGALSALEQGPGARLRMLPLDTVADTFEESLLIQAGMAKAGPEEWARLADTFVWIEFSELDAAPRNSRPRIQLDMTLAAGDGASKNIRLLGTLDALPQLASRAAGSLADALVSEPAARTGGFSLDTRSALAGRLFAAAKAENPVLPPWNTPETKRDFARAARLVELAAFLSPENREWRELHIWMSRSLDKSEGAPLRWSDRFWQLADHFILGPDGSLDIGLLGRAHSHRILVPGSTERFLRLGLALGNGKLPPGHNLENFALNFLNEIRQRPDLPRQVEVFEAMWPALRQALNDPRSHHRYIMDDVYRDDRRRGAEFLTREFAPAATKSFIVSPDPWLNFRKPASPSPAAPRQIPQHTPPRTISVLSPRPESDDSASLNLQLSRLGYARTESAYIESIKPLLAAGADPAWTPPSGKPVILRALERRWTAAAELMLAHVDKLDRPLEPANSRSGSRTIGMALLRSALQNKQIAFTHLLLDAGLIPAQVDDGETGSSRKNLLQLAAENGDARIVRALLTNGFRFSPVMNDNHRSLSLAIRRKDAALLAAFLEPVTTPAGRQTVAVSSYLSTRGAFNLLFAAIEADWAEGIRMLVQAGARSNACDDLGRSVAQVVRAKPELAVVFNDRPGATDNTLEGATAHRAVADLGASPPASDLTPALVAYRDREGETLLMAAARRGDGALIGRLLAAGADADAATTTGHTALSLGILTCDEATVSALLAAGASPDGAPDSDAPPLHVAAFGGNPSRVALLLAAGASPTLRTPLHGMSPIHSAAASPGEIETLRALIATGRIDLSVTNRKGLGVLELAVTADHPEKIQYLLDQGARWQKPHDEDYHPMDVAAAKGLTGSLRKLAQLGLHSPRALSFAKDDATRAILLSDASSEARAARDNEMLWPDILRDTQNWRTRAEALLADGGDVNHQSQKWGDPLTVALWQDDPEMVRFLLDKGVDPVRSQPAFSTSTARTVFFGWMLQLPSRGFVASQRPPKTPEELDSIALAYIELFWKFETHAEARASLLRAAFDARLPRTAERMIALGTSTRSAALSFQETTRLTPEERAFWAALLGIKP